MEPVIDELLQLRHFTGLPHRFWPAFLEGTTRLVGARFAVLLVQDTAAGVWAQKSLWPTEERSVAESPELGPIMERLAEGAHAGQCAWDRLAAEAGTEVDAALLAVRLEAGEPSGVQVVVFFLEGASEEMLQESAARLKLVADIPAIYQSGRVAREVMGDMLQFSEALDLMVLLNTEEKYLAAAMIFVNEVASRYRCPRASLGWLDAGYVRLQAISHMERFEKKMTIVQVLAAAMEEALDQDEEILWPPSDESTAVVRDHEAFAREQGARFMVSVPIRLDDATVGVLTCERSEEPFSAGEVRGLRVLCDQAARRLGDLREQDRWFGARLAAGMRRKAAGLVGVEHTFAKLMGLLLCGMLAFLLFGTLPYRVEAPFTLRSDDVRYLPSPFKGYIEEVHVDVGDPVAAGDILLSLDTRDLLLEESAAIANRVRYSREAEKARAENALAEMKIALALADQAKARLDLVRYQLGRANVRAPFDGVVVEGDFEDLLGAPVEKGDVFFKVARIERMYAELAVSERDIHELAPAASGEMAFMSQPELSFPIEVARIDPVAIAKEEAGNVFIVRCLLSGGTAEWWRPGMSGVAKVSAGRRNVLWILTHRTVDFLRIRLWW
jgi:biotin carboxyl carrier protein